MPSQAASGRSAINTNVTAATTPKAAISLLTVSRSPGSLTAGTSTLSKWKISLLDHRLRFPTAAGTRCKVSTVLQT